MHIQLGLYQSWCRESVSAGSPLTFETALIIWEYTWDFCLLVDENQLFSLLCCVCARVSALGLRNFESAVVNEADLELPQQHGCCRRRGSSWDKPSPAAARAGALHFSRSLASLVLKNRCLTVRWFVYFLLFCFTLWNWRYISLCGIHCGAEWWKCKMSPSSPPGGTSVRLWRDSGSSACSSALRWKGPAEAAGQRCVRICSGHSGFGGVGCFSVSRDPHQVLSPGAGGGWAGAVPVQLCGGAVSCSYSLPGRRNNLAVFMCITKMGKV